jgi:phosphate acetyltransferase
MARTLLLVPIGHRAGLTSVAVGLVRALERTGIRVAFAKPLGQAFASRRPDHSTALIRAITDLHPPEPLDAHHAAALLSEGTDQRLMEEIVAQVGPLERDADVVVVEGLVPDATKVYSSRVNRLMAEALDADLILVGTARARTVAELAEDFDIVTRGYQEKGLRVEGVVLNRVGRSGESPSASLSATAVHRPTESGLLPRIQSEAAKRGLQSPVVGAVPYDPSLAALRVRDLAEAIGARVLREGQGDGRRVSAVRIGDMTVAHLESQLQPGALIVTPGDRADVLMASALASLSGRPLAGVLLTGGYDPPVAVIDLCQRAFEGGMVLLATDESTTEMARRLSELDLGIAADDRVLAEAVANTVASHLDPAWVDGLRAPTRPRRLSPPAFRHRLLEEARAAAQRIVLPEGDEPRTVAAATVCEERGIARCILLASREAVGRTAADQGIVLPDSLETIDPTEVASRYVDPLVRLRAHKGLTPEQATVELEDPVVLGTMMLALGEVDGLVSGAVHTTANTVRPALQLIRTASDARLVSSIFFMGLPDQVLVYGDCAINPDPDAEELADIAIQSAESAAAFGIPPRVAMISYSTGDSGQGADIDKVRRATEIAQSRRPDLCLDGPLQYDAAVIPDVARKKAPESPVAGKATVLVFPDLNTGNTTYKAVQRSARVISIGPMLQGLAKPVNDLSRGASVEDIIYTIALTAIQAKRRMPSESEESSRGRRPSAQP